MGVDQASWMTISQVESLVQNPSNRNSLGRVGNVRAVFKSKEL
jgi:hypothetical protein